MDFVSQKAQPAAITVAMAAAMLIQTDQRVQVTAAAQHATTAELHNAMPPQVGTAAILLGLVAQAMNVRRLAGLRHASLQAAMIGHSYLQQKQHAATAMTTTVTAQLIWQIRTAGSALLERAVTPPHICSGQMDTYATTLTSAGMRPRYATI